MKKPQYNSSDVSVNEEENPNEIRVENEAQKNEDQREEYEHLKKTVSKREKLTLKDNSAKKEILHRKESKDSSDLSPHKIIEEKKEKEIKPIPLPLSPINFSKPPQATSNAKVVSPNELMNLKDTKYLKNTEKVLKEAVKNFAAKHIKIVF